MTTYLLTWIDEDGTLQYPGCSREEATFPSGQEAEAAITSLRETDPKTWGDDVTFKILPQEI
jgi:hypothetical protein